MKPAPPFGPTLLKLRSTFVFFVIFCRSENEFWCAARAGAVCIAGMHWTAAPIHFIDFEGSHATGVVEYGVAVLQGGEVTATATRLCRPRGPIRAEDTAVHGLDAAATAGAAPLADDWELFAGWRQRGPLAAHFAGTENGLLKSVWPYARQSRDFVRDDRTTNDWGPWIDTGRLIPQLFQSIASAKLEELVTRFALAEELAALAAVHCPPERRRYHAALYDALASALLLRAALRRTEFAGATMSWLLQLSALDPVRREAMQQGELF